MATSLKQANASSSTALEQPSTFLGDRINAVFPLVGPGQLKGEIQMLVQYRRIPQMEHFRKRRGAGVLACELRRRLAARPQKAPGRRLNPQPGRLRYAKRGNALKCRWEPDGKQAWAIGAGRK